MWVPVASITVQKIVSKKEHDIVFLTDASKLNVFLVHRKMLYMHSVILTRVDLVVFNDPGKF